MDDHGSTRTEAGQATLQEQRVKELVRRCERDLKSIHADLREGARGGIRGRCAALVTDARLLEQAARRL
jgi:hypothetical protein